MSTIADSRVVPAAPFSYTYQPGTNWVSGRNNADGSSVANQYDVLGRLTRVSASGPTGAAINSYAYAYDAAGQRTQETSSVGTRKFGYDNLRQLTSAYRVDGSGQPLPSYTYGYSYDAIGNFSQELSPAGTATFTANQLNQYTAISGGAFASGAGPQYDADGNMTSDGNGHTYSYDQENRLVEVDNTAGVDGVVKTVSVYDGLSRRVEKDTYGAGNALVATTRYLYDGNLPIAEYDATNTMTRTYTRDLTLSGAGGIGGLMALTNAGGSSYSYFCDGNGNVVDLTDVNGANAAHYEYDPFGNVIAQAGALQQAYQWSSKETDAGTGLVYYLYRFYSPSMGRWTNRDPIEEDGGINLYCFTANAPTNDQDSFGLDESAFGADYRANGLAAATHRLSIFYDLRSAASLASEFGRPLTGQFLHNYLYGNGNPMTLNDSNMSEIRGEFGFHLGETKHVATILQTLAQGPVDYKDQSYTHYAFSEGVTPVDLFTAFHGINFKDDLNGKLCINDDSSITFTGKLKCTVHKNWNFSNPAHDHRKPFATTPWITGSDIRGITEGEFRQLEIHGYTNPFNIDGSQEKGVTITMRPGDINANF